MRKALLVGIALLVSGQVMAQKPDPELEKSLYCQKFLYEHTLIHTVMEGCSFMAEDGDRINALNAFKDMCIRRIGEQPLASAYSAIAEWRNTNIMQGHQAACHHFKNFAFDEFGLGLVPSK